MSTTTGLLSLATGALLAATLAACGGETPSNAASGTPVKSGDEAQLAFAKCMRDHGINVSDPDSQGRTRLEMKSKPGDGMTPEKLQTAMKECREKTGGGPREPTEAERTEMLDQALKFSKCMREHGVDMPDPTASGGGITIRKKAGPGSSSGIDPESPAFKKAEAACEDLMPARRGGDGPSTTKSGGGAEAGDAGRPGASLETEVPAP